MTQADMNDLDSRIGYLLKVAQSTLRGRMDAALRPLGLTTPQYACLELLQRHPGASNAELARDAFVTRQTMNTLLQGLQRRGLIERADQAPSGRALPARLTPEGMALFRQASIHARTLEEQLVSALTGEQRRQLRAALEACIDGLNSGLKAT